MGTAILALALVPFAHASDSGESARPAVPPEAATPSQQASPATPNAEPDPLDSDGETALA